MAGKLTELTALTGANLAAGDLHEVNDVSDTTMAATGTNKSMTTTELVTGLQTNGLVKGPASATDNAIARFDGTTGKLVQDSAVTINDTTGVITIPQAGASTTPLLRSGTDNTTGINWAWTGWIQIISGGGVALACASGGPQIPSTNRLNFSNAVDPASGSVDTAIYRNAAGVLEVNNGSAGTFRDLRARNLRVEPTAVASLVAASTAGKGALAYVTDANATTPRSTVAGGGANEVLVMSNGTNWLIVA